MAAVNKNELRVGVFIIIPVIIVFVLILLKLGYSLAGSTIDLYLKTESIAAIKKGTAVKVKGYTVGRIVDIKPVYKPALHFLATMRVNRDIELYENTTAVIMNQNIIGDAIVELSTPDVKTGLLLAGDVIEGVEYVSLESIFQDVHMLLTSLTETVDVMKQISTESRDNIRSLLGNLSGSVASLNHIIMSSQTDVIEMMASFRKTAQTMDEVAKELQRSPVKFLMRGDKSKKND